jgi:DNA-binding MarR family transcriptional regulator
MSLNEKYESIGRLVSILYRSGQSYLGKQLEPYGIGSGQVAFLAELYRKDGVSQDDLAAFFQCDKATSTRALQRLESQGYVERKRSTKDGRVNLVTLTKKGHEFKPAMVKVLSGWTEVLAQGLSDEERKQMIQLMKRMVANVTENIEAEDNK